MRGGELSLFFAVRGLLHAMCCVTISGNPQPTNQPCERSFILLACNSAIESVQEKTENAPALRTVEWVHMAAVTQAECKATHSTGFPLFAGAQLGTA